MSIEDVEPEAGHRDEPSEGGQHAVTPGRSGAP